MEPKKKQTRKSVPRPNSGRRAVDGATDLVKVGARFSVEQHAWIQKNGQAALRQLVQQRIDAEKMALPFAGVSLASEPAVERVKQKLSGIDYGSMTANQKRYWAKQCERHGIPVPDEMK